MSNVNTGGGENAAHPSAWTIDSLNMFYAQLLDERDRRYEERFQAQEKAVEKALESQEKAVNAAFAAAKEAVDKANTASEKRFDSVNEFRAQLADQTATFLPRLEYDANHTALEDKVEGVEKALTNKIDAAAASLREAISRNTEAAAALGTRVDRAEAAKGGLKEGWGYLVGAVGLVGAVIGIVLVLTR